MRLAGPVFSLPAGAVILSTLLEYNEQSFSEYTQQTFFAGQFYPSTYSAQSSTTKSAYAEAQVPIVADAMQVPFLKRVNLQLAGRFDRYGNVGGMTIFEPASYDPSLRPRTEFRSSDPTFGLQIQPMNSLTFRASYGTGFFPPGLNLLNPSPSQLVSFAYLKDPKRGDEPLGDILYAIGGSTDLRPERSKSTSLGAIFTPRSTELRLSLDWTKISKRDNISGVSLTQQALGLEDLLPVGVAVRSTDPSTFGAFGVGPIVSFNGGYINATSALSESYDFAADYSLNLSSYGEFTFHARATKFIHNEQQLAPAATSDEFVGLLSSPSWQANASLLWNWKSLTASWFTRYLDSSWAVFEHTFQPSLGASRVPSAIYHDLGFQYDLTNVVGSRWMLSGASLQAGVKNVFDKKPRFTGSGSVYDPLGSPMLATYYISLTTQF